jgi:hypothetical protein
VYAVLLEQREFQKICQHESLGDVSSISDLINNANRIITDKGDRMSADQTMKLLTMNIAELKSFLTSDGFTSDADSVATDMSDLGQLTFTYEEESDP